MVDIHCVHREQERERERVFGKKSKVHIFSLCQPEEHRTDFFFASKWSQHHYFFGTCIHHSLRRLYVDIMCVRTIQGMKSHKKNKPHCKHCKQQKLYRHPNQPKVEKNVTRLKEIHCQRLYTRNEKNKRETKKNCYENKLPSCGFTIRMAMRWLVGRQRFL